MVRVTAKEPEFLASSEVAARLGINKSTLSRWVKAGRIKPAYTAPGGAQYFTLAEVERVQANL